MTEPLIVTIDIDGTIIGNITPQVIEWQFIKKYNNYNVRHFKNQLISLLQEYLIRPGMKDFVHKLKEKHSNVHLFLYTASEHKWANFLVPCIEQALDYKFNRPIFTRNHMVVDKKTGFPKKSLERILPQIQKSLQNQSINIKQCIIVDNNKTLIDSEMNRLVFCQTYDYVVYQDPLRYINVNQVKKHLPSIIESLKINLNFNDLKLSDINMFYAQYYNIVSKFLIINCERKDDLWKGMYDSLHKYLKKKDRKQIKDSIISKINKTLKNAGEL